MRRYQFDVPTDGSIHPFSFVCSEDGRDAVTGVSGLVVDDPRDVNDIHPEAPASNLSLNVFATRVRVTYMPAATRRAAPLVTLMGCSLRQGC
jgi:hypothetical protein